MKRLITRAQLLGRKAAELRQVVQSLPGQAAKIREAVTMTGGELQQLRADVQSSIHALKADSEDHLLAAMRDINDHTETFRQAGYELTGLDLDFALHQRLAVHLEKIEDIPQSALRSLLGRQTNATVRSILGGILKAEETAANVELSELAHTGLVMHVGPIPMVRLLWRPLASEVAVEEPVPTTTFTSEPTTFSQPAPASALPAPSAPSSTGASKSMFELRPLPGGRVRVDTPSTAPETAPLPAPPSPSPIAARPASWSQSALDRFKKMPGASKY